MPERRRRTTPRAAALLVLIASLFCCLAGNVARAQLTRFENFADERGIGNVNITALAQDSDGYILFGTESGLFRYDGVGVTEIGATSGLPPGSSIRKLMPDRWGRLWVVTLDGIFLRQGEQFRALAMDGSPDLRWAHLITLTSDSLLVADGRKLWRSDLTAAGAGPLRFWHALEGPGGGAGDADPRFLVDDGINGMLFGCGPGICRLAPDGKTSAIGTADGLPADQWWMARRGPDGTLWARSASRLAWKKNGEGSFGSTPVPRTPVRTYERLPFFLNLLPDAWGGVLTQGDKGLLQWTGRDWHMLSHHEGGLSAVPIQSMMLDREGSLWVGSIGHGAFRSIGFGVWEHWTADDGLPSELVWGATRAPGGDLWVATYGDTVPLGKTTGIPGGSANVAATRAGLIWTTPLGAPLMRTDPRTGTTDKFPFLGRISAMVVDRENRLWLCAQRALFMVADADAPPSQIRLEPVLPHNTFQVAADPQGMLWALTADGLFRRDAMGRFGMVSGGGLVTGDGGGLAFAGDGSLWVSSNTDGITRFHVSPSLAVPLSRIGTPTLGSNNVMFMHRDARGWMWVGTDHGLDMFDNHRWRRFNKIDGLNSNDMNQWAVFEDADSSLWFGTSLGLTHLVDPTRLPAPLALHPRITAVMSGATAMAPAAKLRIPWSPAPLTIRFADLDFARGVVRFHYRMVGLESGWQETDAREVGYGRVPPGRYRFELVAVDPTHDQHSDPVTVDVVVTAPWWRRWWFFALCLVAIVGMVILAWQMRVKLLLMRQQRLEGMVQVRTAEIDEARRELQRLAMSDALTGLPNRRAIMAALDEAVLMSKRTQRSLGILLCDIDHFKKINDNHGHGAGDRVLSAFGLRLTGIMRPPEVAGRYGGEEFLVILPGPEDGVTARVEEIRRALGGIGFEIDGTERHVTSSGGLAFLQPNETTVNLIARADVALYRAKEDGRDRVELADAVLVPREGGGAQPRSARRNLPPGLAAALRRALERDEFSLHYQPVVDVDRNVPTSCEALLRWHAPGRDPVSPGVFIPLAEEMGLMPEIGDWVLRAACTEARGWPDHMQVSVNLSPSQFQLPDLVGRIEAALRDTGLPAWRLELEITETAMIHDIAAATVMLQGLRGLGICIALDDFGTGYSSLSFLRTLPFNRIKIDRSFVQDLGLRREAVAIVSAIRGLCGSLDAHLTVEGVETDQQLQMLRALGCREIQGYLIARPMPRDNLAGWLLDPPCLPPPAIASRPDQPSEGTMAAALAPRRSASPLPSPTLALRMIAQPAAG
ncbi:EAL domain-containing protein [Rhizosaccharibacter radicis]|uniref:EAL domain-containing protein n=1 Tax=Rhizosaccharibacter radicis TaxID=2782605 RepID=A0ABT1W2F7_9PROT|nr:EAL domain-containing protein [Acetobacteraceae bacterium KSS12]